MYHTNPHLLFTHWATAKGLLTKSGYITEIEKNDCKLYTNNSSIMPKLSRLKKKIECNQDIFVQS